MCIEFYLLNVETVLWNDDRMNLIWFARAIGDSFSMTIEQP